MPAGCGLTELNARCDTCLQASCCSEAQACAADPSCVELIDCLATAPFTDGGASACASPSSVPAYGAFTACMQTSCSLSCASCHGVPEACSLHADETHCVSAGCAWGGACQGVETACFEIFGSFACGSQMGCYYDSTTGNCTGFADSCDSILGEFSCASQMGCNWQMACSGVAFASCTSMLDESSCIAAGCLWD
jgi:hypothetical protein